MVAKFNQNDWPNSTNPDHEETKDINWQVRVFASETVAICKDTDKEDKENALKESWETEDPGRAEKAKSSRMRWTLLKKQ